MLFLSCWVTGWLPCNRMIALREKKKKAFQTQYLQRIHQHWIVAVDCIASLNSYVEVPTPNVMVFGNGIFGRCLDLDEVRRVGPLIMRLVSLLIRGRGIRAHFLTCHVQAGRRALTRSPPCWHSFLIVRKYNCKKIYFCCLIHQVCGTLLW